MQHIDTNAVHTIQLNDIELKTILVALGSRTEGLDKSAGIPDSYPLYQAFGALAKKRLPSRREFKLDQETLEGDVDHSKEDQL